VDDRQSTINFVEQNSKQTRVHAFGIGGSVDRSLIIECAKATNGAFAFIAEASGIKEKVISVLKRGMVPALSNMQIHWPSDTYVQYPSNQLLPVCYFGEAFYAFVHLGKTAVQAGNVLLTGTNTANKRNLSWEVPIDTNCGVGNFIEKLWAKYAIKELSLDYRQTQNRDTLQKVKSLSKQYGVPCEHTAFICVQTNVQPVEGKLQMTSISMGVPQARQGPIGVVSALGGHPNFQPGLFLGPPQGIPQPRMQYNQMPSGMPMYGAPGGMMKPGFVQPNIQQPMMFGALGNSHASQMQYGPTQAQGGFPMMRQSSPGPPKFPQPMMAGAPAVGRAPPMQSGPAPAQGGFPMMGQFSPGPSNFPQPMMAGAPAGGHAHPMQSGPAPAQAGFPGMAKLGPVPENIPQQVGPGQAPPMQYMGAPASAQGGFGGMMYPGSSGMMKVGMAPVNSPQPMMPMQGSPVGLAMSPQTRLPTANSFQPVSSFPHLDFTKVSLLDLISRQEVDGKWLFASIPDVIGTCPLPADFGLQGSDALDLWVTLCVVVLIKKKFAAQEKEWELVVKKTVKLLKRAGVNIDQYSAQIEAQLGF
jgi:hypothetical protein